MKIYELSFTYVTMAHITRCLEMDINFYHFLYGDFDKTVANLINKIYESSLQVVLLLESPEQLNTYNNLLWRFSQKSFIPHGSSQEGFASEQPVWLTTKIENPNNSDIIVSLANVIVDNDAPFKKILEVFNGKDHDKVHNARIRWKHYKENCNNMKYWSQDSNGKWLQK